MPAAWTASQRAAYVGKSKLNMNTTYNAPATHHATIARRRSARQRGMIDTIAATPRAPVTPHREFSKMWPRFDVVRTAVHEQISAVRIRGRMSRDTIRAVRLPVAWAMAWNRTAHCAAKQSSAAVATERPTMTLENQVSNRPSRGMSYTGTTERKAQPNT